MTQERRFAPPMGDDTGPARNGAQKALQRRLRQTVGGVEWRDAIAGAVLGQMIDALGGEALGDYVAQLLVRLLNP